ncbi:MAG: Smr/MutS family protein [Rhodoferax sp.]
MSSKPQPARTLADLKRFKPALAEQAQAQRAALAEQLQQEKERKAQRSLFVAAVGAVRPLVAPRKADLAPAPPAPLPRQRQRDEAAVLRETISDTLDVSRLLDTDDLLSYRRSGVGPDVTAKLRRGEWSVQAQIDLHGLRSDAAREALGQFVRKAHQQGLRCVRVVHGKGLGSPGKTPVLKAKAQRWLVQKSEVLAFVQAAPAQGGAGALLVLLQPVHRSALRHAGGA